MSDLKDRLETVMFALSALVNEPDYRLAGATKAFRIMEGEYNLVEESEKEASGFYEKHTASVVIRGEGGRVYDLTAMKKKRE